MSRVLAVLRHLQIARVVWWRWPSVIRVIGAVNVMAVIAATGCYEDPDYSTAGFKCDAEHGCPAHQTCVNRTCMLGSGPAGAVVCGAVACDASQKCCLDGQGGAACIALTGSCPAIAARCDGIEDCSGGACCAPRLGDIQCGEVTCDTQVCRENGDCLDRSAPLCCLGVGLPNQPWGFCSPVCLTAQ